MEIIPQVHRIERVRGANVYLLVDDTLTLIDTGLPGNGKRILAYITRIGRAPAELNRIIITHNHIDHAGSVGELSAQTAAKIMLHPADAEITRNGDVYLSPNLEGVQGWFLDRLMYFVPLPTVKVDQLLNDGEFLPCLGGLRIIHVPGHTPGSICLFLVEKKVLFTGDVVINNGPRLSRPLPYPGVSVRQSENSLRKLIDLEVDTCCFSHGKPIVGNASPKLHQFITSPPSTPLWWRVTHNIHTLTLFALRLIR